MATVPTPEESAKRILSIFSNQRVRAGEILMTGQLNIQFLKGDWRAEDYTAGMKYAVEQQWITAEPTMIRLTDAGFAAM